MGTLKWFFSCVNIFMLHEMIALFECLITLVTFEWSFICMNTFMLNEVLPVDKSSSALITDEWSFPSVNKFVFDKLLPLNECLIALVALVFPLQYSWLQCPLGGITGRLLHGIARLIRGTVCR
jgi:hypothetical protein